MHVDQSRQHGLARGFDRFRVQALRIGKGAFVNLGDFSAANQDRAGLDHLAVADKDARILNQEGAPAFDVALQDFCLR